MVNRMVVAMFGTLALGLVLSGGWRSEWVRAAERYVRREEGKAFAGRSAVKAEAASPKTVFWAWERAEDLRFLDGEKAGVAFLAKTIYLFPAKGKDGTSAARNVVVRGRRQPLRVNTNMKLVAVVRIETRNMAEREPRSWNVSEAMAEKPEGGAPEEVTRVAEYSAAQRERIVAEVVELTSWPQVAAVQIDFDATRSEIGFYKELLTELHGKLPANVPLSITALTSWCIGDRWLESLPAGTIQEAIPMLFRMGPDAGNVAQFLAEGKEFPVAACQSSLGVSTDERISTALLQGKLLPRSEQLIAKRIYVFAPKAWSAGATEGVLKELKR